jgi:hypothetical protein
LNNPSDAFLLAAVSSSMFSDVTTTNGSNMIDDDDDDDDNDYNDNRGDASYRDYMSAMKYNLD